MTIKAIIALTTSVILFIYTTFHPYFFFPQLIDHNWGYFYDFLDYFSMGGFLVVIVGLSHQLFLLALGKQITVSNNSSINSIGSINYYFRRIIGGTDKINNDLNKEKNPFLVSLSKAILVLTMVFTMRILMLLFASTLYEYSPQNFMLVLNSELIAIHSIYGTLNTLLQALSMIFLISTAFGSISSLYEIYRLIFKKVIWETNKKGVMIIVKIILPFVFFALHQACLRIINVIISTN
jgi:hypothetical protein